MMAHSRSSSSSSSSIDSALLHDSSAEHETVVSETQYDDDDDGFDIESSNENETEDDAPSPELLQESGDADDAYDDDAFELDDTPDDADADDGDDSDNSSNWVSNRVDRNAVDSAEDAYSTDSFDTSDASAREESLVVALGRREASDSYAEAHDSVEARERTNSSSLFKVSRRSSVFNRHDDDIVESDRECEHSRVLEPVDTRVALASHWCARKIQTLRSADASANEANASRPSSSSSPALDHRIPLQALDALGTRLRRRSRSVESRAAGVIDVSARSSSPQSRVRARCIAARASMVSPDATSKLMDRAQTARLLHMTFDHLVANESGELDEEDWQWQVSTEIAVATATATMPSLPLPTRLETFCAAKRTHLARKLATLRFADRYAYTCAGDASGMSLETLAFVSDMVAAQRQSVGVSSCWQTHAVHLDATVATTKRRLHESRSLRKRAAQLLQTRDAYTESATATRVA